MINKENKSKWLLLIIGILLITNIALLAFVFLKKDRRTHEKHTDRKAMISAFLKNEIGFNTVQLHQYDSLSSSHKEKVKKMFENLRSSKDKQFKQLASANFSDSVIETVASLSAGSQKTMELQMFSHLRNVRMLCTAEQLPKFDSLFVKVLNRRNRDGKNEEKKN